MVGEFDGVFLPELQLLELALRAVDATDHALGEKNSDRNQGPGDRDDHQQQHGTDPARGLAQRVREPDLPGLELFVNFDDAAQYEPELGTIRAAAGLESVQLRGSDVEPGEESVSGLPDIEHAAHVTHVTKALI